MATRLSRQNGPVVFRPHLAMGLALTSSYFDNYILQSDDNKPTSASTFDSSPIGSGGLGEIEAYSIDGRLV